ncbi:MAG TPA: hypothetical protein VG122_15910 [Gemmata sp.]|jgi:hypothetical protein|nr:hypothetical protein [Gemmata sp.]
MPRPKKSVPSYLHHKPTNQPYVPIPNGNGVRKPVYLGLYDSPESRVEYARIVQELSITPILKSADQIAVGGSDVTINEVLLAFLGQASMLQNLVEGELLVERPEPLSGNTVSWDPDPVQHDPHRGSGGIQRRAGRRVYPLAGLEVGEPVALQRTV